MGLGHKAAKPSKAMLHGDYLLRVRRLGRKLKSKDYAPRYNFEYDDGKSTDYFASVDDVKEIQRG